MQEQNVNKGHFSSKLLFICISIFFCNHSFSQTKYFLLNEDTSRFKITKYTLKTDELYQLNDSIIIYNLLFKRLDGFINKKDSVASGNLNTENLILFSVLPSLDGNSWDKISLDSISKLMVEDHELVKLFYKNIYGGRDGIFSEKTKYWNEYKIIIKKNGKYFVPKNVLLQFYTIRNQPSVFITPCNTINIGLDKYDIKTVQDIFDREFVNQFPLFTFKDDFFSADFDKLRDRKEFLSKKYMVGEKVAYQFWTFTDWSSSSHVKYDYERGIDRFVFIENEGIVGGSFDFYFFKNRKKLNLTVADFIKNIEAEKIMIAEGV